MQLREMHTIIILSTIKQKQFRWLFYLVLGVLKHTIDTEQIWPGIPICKNVPFCIFTVCMYFSFFSFINPV